MAGFSFRARMIGGLALSGLALCGAVGGAKAALATLTPELEQAKSYIEASEAQWVASIVSGKTDDLNRILADDFGGVDPDGHPYDKTTFLGEIVEAPKYYTSNKLNGVTVRFFSPTLAVAQGDETFERTIGDLKRARFVFTDTWLLRDGKWQVVASQTLTAPEVAK